MTIVTLLITPLITAHEPPSRVQGSGLRFLMFTISIVAVITLDCCFWVCQVCITCNTYLALLYWSTREEPLRSTSINATAAVDVRMAVVLATFCILRVSLGFWGLQKLGTHPKIDHGHWALIVLQGGRRKIPLIFGS